MTMLIRALFRALRRTAFIFAGMAWLAGWVLGDRSPPWIWLYFIPAPVIALWGVVDLAVHLRRAGRVRAGIIITLTALALIKTFLVDMRWAGSRPFPPHAMRLVHWNVAHARFGYIPLFRELARDRPDVVVFVEAPYSEDVPFLVQRELGLPHTFQDQGMMVSSRFPFEPQGTIALPNARAWWARLDTPQGPLRIFTVDLISHPTLNRAAALSQLARWIAEHPEPSPLLIVGDFNTLRDARAFQALRQGLRNAYEVAGRGWPYSWPLPTPMYAIDHTWVSDTLDVHHYRFRPSALSDHLRQVMMFSITNPQMPVAAQPR